MTTEQMREYTAMRRTMRMLTNPRSEYAKSVMQAVRRELTVRQQEAVYLYYIKQMTMREVAEIQGVDISTISRTLARARRRLQRVLSYLPRFRGEEEPDFESLMTDRL